MSNVPIGFISLFPGENIPDNWRICDGRPISKSEIPDSFADLANVLGQTEENAESIQLPDLMDRFVVGAGMDAELRSSGEADQHTHENDPPPQRRYTSYGDQFVDAASTQYFKQPQSNEMPEFPENFPEERGMEEATTAAYEEIAPMSLEHHNHYVELDIEPFESEPSRGLNRPKYYALHFVIRVA